MSATLVEPVAPDSRALTVLPPPPGPNIAAALAKLAILAGVLLLVGVAGFLSWTRHSGSERAADTVQALQEQWRESPQAPVVGEQPGSGPAPSAAATVPGKAFAIMTVPRFGSDWKMPVFEGTGAPALRAGVGHYAGTARPGEIGNFAVAGHRTTWARPFQDVDRLRAGDKVVVQTREARFTYRVTDHELVRPDQTAVLDAVPGQARLTMTTCHPEYSDSQRWIVHAELVEPAPIGG
ncbi:class E sortase [Kineosporia sp. NBRC 101677]|uniref:class E sortase n=1 Tax=Kineosporia sp. NBRC 101677 TaxID=3032197 RepID=UPI0024A3E8BE|nr:class E sortase [Kineosporia sp. NBRC 101677]GLY15040.1 class E sortase [Kineosporia sp. NBRC 101677]